MPAEQPANTNVTLVRHVRTRRDDTRFTSVKRLANNMADLNAVVPSEEIEIIRTYDSNTYAAQTYYTSQNHYMPLVVYPRPVTTYQEVMAAGINVRDVKVGRDRFFIKETGHENEDIHANVRAVK